MALTDGLVSTWHFDEGTGVIASDSVGGNTLATYSLTWAGAGNGITPQSGGANSGNAGVYSWAYCANFATSGIPSGASARTISCWFKISIDQMMGLVGIGSEVGVGKRFVVNLRSGQIGVHDGDYGAYAVWVHDYNWHMVTVTLGAGGTNADVKIYLDDTELTVTDMINNTYNTNSDVYTGCNLPVGSYFMEGMIDEVNIWNRALSVEEVAELFLDSVTIYTDIMEVPLVIIPSATNKIEYKNINGIPLSILPASLNNVTYKATSNYPLVITSSSSLNNVTYKATSNYPLVITSSSLNELITMLDGFPSRLPGPKTNMSLYELNVTQSNSGSQIEYYTVVQNMMGSLQPLNAREIELYNKETVVANYKFIVSRSVFRNAVNEAKLVEKNLLTLGSRKFDIVFRGERIEGIVEYYCVLLKEKESDLIIDGAGDVVGGYKLDISDNTNLAVTDPISLTDDTIGLKYSTTDFKLSSKGNLELKADLTSVTDTNSIDLTLTGSAISADVKKQNSTTIDLSVDTNGLKADLDHLGIEDLTDAGADKVMFWDESGSKTGWLTLGTNLSITDDTINAVDTDTKYTTADPVSLSSTEIGFKYDTDYGQLDKTGNYQTKGNIRADGSITLSSDWDIGDGRQIKADKIIARDGAGISLQEDSGVYGYTIDDNGDASIKLGDKAGVRKVTIQDSDGATMFTIDSDGLIIGTALKTNANGLEVTIDHPLDEATPRVTMDIPVAVGKSAPSATGLKDGTKVIWYNP